jgi:hypothetical protein
VEIKEGVGDKEGVGMGEKIGGLALRASVIVLECSQYLLVGLGHIGG